MPEATTAAVPRKLLLAVRELHLRGFERLRIAPSIAPTGLAWRCGLTDADSTLVEHGARVCPGGRAVYYTSGYGSDYFRWGEMSTALPAQLADEIEARLPDLMAAAKGQDPVYVTWYEDMLRATDPEYLPYARADWDVPDDHIPASAPWANLPPIRLPLPPPGHCSGRGWPPRD